MKLIPDIHGESTGDRAYNVALNGDGTIVTNNVPIHTFLNLLLIMMIKKKVVRSYSVLYLTTIQY